ncbi:MAG: hypothetical protein V7651_00465 [Hyphomonas oceanitis]|uniref:hypothetical protein n=1 Tax=Hyphomonas oceanitis TaxID=81033 RepID=UPI0030037C09
MEDMSWGVIAAIAVVAIVVLSIIYNFAKGRIHASGNAPITASPPDSQTAPDPVTAAMLMSKIVTAANTQNAFDDYIKDHTRDQLDDVPVYTVAHIITASIPSRSRKKWLSAVAAATVPRGADPELVNTADYFWDVNEKWLFSETAFADFCNQYLIAYANEWPSAVHERILLAGYTALASRDLAEAPDSPDMTRVVSDFMAGLDSVAEVYFGAEAEPTRARFQAEAERLAPAVRANMG